MQKHKKKGLFKYKNCHIKVENVMHSTDQKKTIYL